MALAVALVASATVGCKGVPDVGRAQAQPHASGTVRGSQLQSPLLWQRTYVEEVPRTAKQLEDERAVACYDADKVGVRENDSPGPRIGVLGDSVQTEIRMPTLADPSIHWIHATHCGEKTRSAIDSGRVAKVVQAHPDVLVLALGFNDLTTMFVYDPKLVSVALASLQEVLDATEGVPCRVLVGLTPLLYQGVLSGYEESWSAAIDTVNSAMRAAESRPGVHFQDWYGQIRSDPSHFTYDTVHSTRAGINARINGALETARQCWRPDPPANVVTTAESNDATVAWDPRPEPEHVTSYDVERSDGRSFSTAQPTLRVSGSENGVRAQFRVRAVNPSGASDWGPWTVQ